MKTLAIILAFVCAANALTFDQHFELFKFDHGKKYKSTFEHNIRREIFRKNFDYIEKHNTEFINGQHSYTLGVNKFADMTHEEFLLERTSSKKKVFSPPRTKPAELDISSLPEKVDWRDEGYVTPIKDQKQCGSCWTFSATGCMEGQHFKKTGTLVSLSEQQLLDCVHPLTDGCNGGSMDDAFKYAIRKGSMSEDSYSYTAEDGSCEFDKDLVVADFTDYKDVEFYSEEALTKAIANVGPISVGIDASLYSFQLYHSGVYDPSGCSSYSLDHGVLAVGYGTHEGKDYYMVKNSWGTSWGMDGYIMMARNNGNKCGIATDASHIVA